MKKCPRCDIHLDAWWTRQNISRKRLNSYFCELIHIYDPTIFASISYIIQPLSLYNIGTLWLFKLHEELWAKNLLVLIAKWQIAICWHLWYFEQFWDWSHKVWPLFPTLFLESTEMGKYKWILILCTFHLIIHMVIKIFQN